MNAKRNWMIGCIVFAVLSIVLSAWLVLSSAASSFNQYASGIHDRFIRDQRDAMFRLISKIQPPLTAEQIEAAALASSLHFEKKENSIRLGNGIEFVMSEKSVAGVRSQNF
jgi:uncharacterized protein YggT (Ycf19 family)